MDRKYTYKLLRCVYNVYDELGPGLLESIYEEALAKELINNGFSIERQKEIVATLDRFDDLCNDIESGIPAEIEARTKQYEYYRDKLLTFKRKQL